MICYMVTFGPEVCDEFVFTDLERAEKRLEELKAEQIENARKYEEKSYDDWYELREFELIGKISNK